MRRYLNLQTAAATAAAREPAGLQDAVVALLRSVVAALARLSPDEFAALVGGRGKLVYVGPEDQVVRGGRAASSKQPSARRKRRRSEEELREIERHFVASPDRETARRVLEQASLTRDDLLGLARRLAVPVASWDSVAAITFKLVEGVIGARLRSEALRKVDIR